MTKNLDLILSFVRTGCFIASDTRVFYHIEIIIGIRAMKLLPVVPENMLIMCGDLLHPIIFLKVFSGNVKNVSFLLLFLWYFIRILRICQYSDTQRSPNEHLVILTYTPTS